MTKWRVLGRNAVRRVPVRLVGCAVAALVWAASARAAAVWLAPADISSASVDVDVPRVALDASGDAVAVWYQSIGLRDVIESATRPAGGGWSAPVEVASGSNAYGPRVRVDARGDATVVWYQFDGNQDVVEAASRPAGGSWSAPQQLSVPLVTGGDADEPALAVDPNGDAVAVWYQSDGTNDVIMAASRPAGGSWSPPVEVSAAGGDAYGAEVAIDSSGDASAVWYRYNGGVPPGIVQAATLPAGGIWSAPRNLSTGADDSSEPQVASDPSGNVTAVWSSYNGSTDLIEAARRPLGGSWSAPQQISAGGADADAPQVAIDGQGMATAVWDSLDGTNFVVQAAATAQGGGWSAPVGLSVASVDAGEPQVAADALGDVVAVWYRFNGLGDVIEAATSPAGGRWSASEQLSGSDAYQPQIALAPQGQATAVWYLSTGNAAAIQASSTTTPVSQTPGGGTSGGTAGQGGGAGGLGAGGFGVPGAPVISSLRVRPHAFEATRRGKVAKTGTTVSYRDSTAATTTFTILALPPNQRCTAAQRRRRQCVTRGRQVGGFVHRDHGGTNLFHFSGRLGRRTLPPGRYRLVASPRDRVGRIGAARTVDFRIIR